MGYTVSFISLGCAKNQVNCEQMMAAVQAAGHTVTAVPEGSDVVVVNTCGFLTSACEEAIENILEMAELKKAGRVKKILVTGCMAQRYQEDVLREMPEVDGILGTGSYGEIAAAVGSPKAFRAVGMANHQNPIFIAVPCHRVIGAGGKLVGYGGGLDMKEALLQMERRALE